MYVSELIIVHFVFSSLHSCQLQRQLLVHAYFLALYSEWLHLYKLYFIIFNNIFNKWWINFNFFIGSELLHNELVELSIELSIFSFIHHQYVTIFRCRHAYLFQKTLLTIIHCLQSKLSKYSIEINWKKYLFQNAILQYNSIW